MTDPTITEAAARAVQRKSDYVLSNETAQRIATTVLAAVTPLIEEAALKRWHHDLAYVRAAALEEAAQVAEKDVYPSNWAVAAAIRALKEQP